MKIKRIYNPQYILFILALSLLFIFITSPRPSIYINVNQYLLYPNNFEKIYMTMSLNKKGILVASVAITSLMVSSKKFLYEFFIIVDNISNIEYQKIKFLEKIYKRLTINFIDHSPRTDEFAEYIPHEYWPLSSCYRLWLPDLLPNIDKIIHIDYDCLITGELNEMYNINMNNLNIRGVIDPSPYNNDEIIRNNKYICSGILLLNLKRMRETNIVKKYEAAIINYSKRLKFPDQNIINSVDLEHNDLLPLRYGIMFVGISPTTYYYGIRCKDIYTADDFIESFNNPVIAHLVWKPFHRFFNKPIYIKWWEIAMISCYGDDIKEKYEIYNKYSPLLNQTLINEKRSNLCMSK